MPQGNSLHSIAFDGTQFVSVGDAGVILSSTDGVHWTLRNSTTSSSLRGVSYLNGTFYAVGDNGTIVSSTNGADWSSNYSGVTTPLYSIAYGAGALVIVGYQGTVLRSTTGQSWVPQAGVSSSLYLNSVAFGNNVFVAVSSQGNVITSSDGITWGTQSGQASYPTQVAFLNNQFVIVAFPLQYSPDGTNWTTVVVDATPNAMLYLNGSYLGVGYGGIVQTSTDGEQWTWVTSYESSDDLYSVACGNGIFVAVGMNGVIRTSPDGDTWTIMSQDLAGGLPLNSIRCIQGQLMAVGDAILTNSLILVSGTSTNWYALAEPAVGNLVDIAYGNRVYVAITSARQIAVSTNCADWLQVSPPWGTSDQLTGVIYGNNLFVLFTYGGQIATSPDGTNWTARVSGTTDVIRGMVFGNGLFVGVSHGYGSATTGHVLTSRDGLSWASRYAGFGLGGVVCGSGRYVRVGYRGHAAWSTDGTNWTTVSSGTTNTLMDVSYGGGVFVAVGDWGNVQMSYDGATWASRKSGTVSFLKAVGYANGTFAAIGDGATTATGTLLQSDSVFPSLKLHPVGAALELDLVGGVARSYTVQTNASLSSASWSTLMTLPSWQPLFTDTNIAAPAKFYRLSGP